MNATVSQAALVSVVIPTRNRVELLRRALMSVLDQTHPHLEVIVVDDASTDDTACLLRDFNDPRIRYLRHERNRGGSAARNTGVCAATGDYIAFLDDDDEWLPQKTKRQLWALQYYDAVLCSSDVANTTKLTRGRLRPLRSQDFRRSPFAVGGTGVLMAHAHVLKQTLFDESLPRAQDWDLFIRIALKYRIAFLNEPLLHYNAGAHPRITNDIVTLPPAELEKRVAMLDKHKDFFGRRWYHRHVGGLLIYGIKHRPDKLQHLAYTLRRCGIAATAEILAQRGWRRLCERQRAPRATAVADTTIGRDY